MSEWAKCANVTLNPERVKFKVPPEMAEDHSFLYVQKFIIIFFQYLLFNRIVISFSRNKYKYVARQRVINVIAPTPAFKPKSEADAGVKVKTEVSEAMNGPPLKGFVFVLDSKLDRSKEDITKDIEELGGKVSSRFSEKIAAFISTKGCFIFMHLKFHNDY